MNNAAHSEGNLAVRIWRCRQAYLYLVPILAFLVIFKYYPFFTAVWESFYNWNGANINVFTGLDNYINLFKDSLFFTSLLHVTIIMVANIIITMTFPMIASLLVFHCTYPKVRNFFKVAFVLPMVVPGVVTLLMWRWLYEFDYGAINQVLRAAGLGSLAHSWLGDTNTALGSLIFIGFPWIQGLPFLIYLGGLLSISGELFEASIIDGANWRQKLACIELPLIKSQIRLMVMLTIINSLQAFENVLIVTNGGPGTSTYVPALHLFNQAFSYNNMGYASAVGVVLFTVILILTVLNYNFIKPSDKID